MKMVVVAVCEAWWLVVDGVRNSQGPFAETVFAIQWHTHAHTHKTNNLLNVMVDKVARSATAPITTTAATTTTHSHLE